MSAAGRGHVNKLTSRAAWLQATIDTQAGSPGSLGHAAAELAALQWAVPILTDMLNRGVEEARDVHKQRAHAQLCDLAAECIVGIHTEGYTGWYDELVAKAPKRVQDRVDVLRFGAPVPQAAET